MRTAILSLLKKSPGQYVSGEEISKKLEVSRTAIWKHIKILRGEGYLIHSSSKLGYSLQKIPDKVLPEQIKNGLNTKFLGQKVEHFDEVGSTNDIAKELAKSGCLEGMLVVAEKQIKGRGRLGRTWDSQSTGLWFSLVLRPKLSLQEVGNLTFVAAVAITQVLREHYGLPVMIKWPNDLYLHGKKFCGILTEMDGEADCIHHIVMGIGINVNQRAEAIPEEIQHKATSLCMHAGEDLNRVELLKAILQALETWYELYLSDGREKIYDYWQTYNITIGQDIYLNIWDQQLQGKAIGINEQGGLVVDLKTGERKVFYSGDVTLVQPVK
jgi:BirA family biotin operon repressor/biotin-[acetyl-CoA-carboxylase] ligase